MLVIDTHTTLLTHIELLIKKLPGSNLGKANVSQIQTPRHGLHGGECANERCSLEGSSEEVQFANFKKNRVIPTPIIRVGKITRISIGAITKIQMSIKVCNKTNKLQCKRDLHNWKRLCRISLKSLKIVLIR